MEERGTKGWEGRAAPGKWQLGAGAGAEEESRGMEIGDGVGRVSCGSGRAGGCIREPSPLQSLIPGMQ